MKTFKVMSAYPFPMYEVRFHGRGGQGAVTAANILAYASMKQGFYAQAFPYFGVERRGAPVQAFTRIDKNRIDLRMNVYEPDAVVVLDPTLMNVVDITQGLKKGGIIVINTAKKPENFNFSDYKVATVNATEIAILHHLGSQAAPIVNTAILGAYAKAVGNVKIEHILEAIRENAPAKKEENAKAAEDAYEKTILGW